MRLMRVWPRSLGGQLMLVTAVTLLAAQSVNLVLLVRAQRNQAAVATAAGAVVQINDVLERLQSGEVPPDWTRPARDAERLRRDGPRPRRARHIVIANQPVIPPGLRDWPEVEDQVRRGLGSVGPQGRITAVTAAHGRLPARPGADRPVNTRRGDQLFEVAAVAVRLNDGRWVTVRARRPVPNARIGALLIGQTLILFALLLGPLLFVAWRVSRPLGRLVDAAQAMGPGGDRAALPETGPRDVRDLTHAFNSMRERILAMLRDKDRMLGAIGHDLRTPLASLRVRVEQVEDEVLRTKLVATIDDMTTMLGNILMLARANQPQEAPEMTDLAAMLAAIVDDYRAMDKPVALAAEGALVHLAVRPSALRGAVRNLIDNAVAYAGSARVGLHEQSDGGVAISVEDDGPGIAPERIDAMLEPFVRAEESRNRATGGSGLGLTLARAVAMGEGGELVIRNREPHGLCASIVLPRRQT